MQPTKGYYTLVQFCPDRSRMEAANVGVILCVPDTGFVRARMATRHDRLRRLWRNKVDLKWLRIAKESIERRVEVTNASLSDMSDLQRYIETRANQFILTPPRPVKVTEPEQELGHLFEELVDRRSPRRTRHATIPEFEAAFHRPDLANRIEFNHQVTVPIIGRTLKIPYAYHNGALHLIRPLAVEQRSSLQPIESVATEGDLVQRKSERQCKMVIVPELRFDEDMEGRVSRRMMDELFKAYNLRTVWHEERDAFIAEVEQEARSV